MKYKALNQNDLNKVVGGNGGGGDGIEPPKAEAKSTTDDSNKLPKVKVSSSSGG